jgi:Fur family peroxide stress response transcriptional regulator
MKQSAQRQTQYCNLVEKLIYDMGHATNAELLAEVRHIFPSISATTIHRITTRLAERGEIAIAPTSKDGSIRYDANIEPHDHFQCTKCDSLRDVDIKDSLAPLIQSHIEGCKISGNLIIGGICKLCTDKR